MEERRAAEILAAHADRLNGLPGQAPEPTPEETAYLAPLMEIAERLKETLVPVGPSEAFVRSLERELVEAARRQQATPPRFRRGLVIGAAAIGSVISLTGVIALILRHRRRLSPHPSAGPAGVHP